jgi:hypothetical protein
VSNNDFLVIPQEKAKEVIDDIIWGLKLRACHELGLFFSPCL